MGESFKSKCKDCGNEFIASFGGGICSFLYHCEKCGKEKWLWYRDIGLELVEKYFKVSKSSKKFEKYRDEIDEKAGKCRCRGKYRLFAKPRCPECRSDDLEIGEIFCNYD